MQVELEHTLRQDISPERFRARLLAWAEANGFTAAEELPNRWVLRRGSHWHALYTFNIRKVPTAVVVRHLPLTGEVACSLVCGSPFQAIAPWERATLQKDFDSLLACLAEIDLSAPESLADGLGAKWDPPGDTRYTGGRDGYSGA
jgi:hypothetical protein